MYFQTMPSYYFLETHKQKMQGIRTQTIKNNDFALRKI